MSQRSPLFGRKKRPTQDQRLLDGTRCGSSLRSSLSGGLLGLKYHDRKLPGRPRLTFSIAFVGFEDPRPQPRTSPLSYLPHGENCLVIASNAGEPRHPAWLLNLMANDRAAIQRGRSHTKVSARLATGGERARLVRLATGRCEQENRHAEDFRAEPPSRQPIVPPVETPEKLQKRRSANCGHNPKPPRGAPLIRTPSNPVAPLPGWNPGLAPCARALSRDSRSAPAIPPAP